MKIVLLFLTLVFAPGYVSADSESPQPTEESGNYKKSGEKLLPGEEVVTPTGKKIRVWDTSGPVPVASVPPEPFQQRDRIRAEDLNVIVAPPTGR